MTPKPVPVLPRVAPTPELITKERFIAITQIVIDHFESGYFHPNMTKRMSQTDRNRLAASGETMYGLDRKAGIELAKFNPEWTEFWALIDKADAKTRWDHYYMGDPAIRPRLKELAASIMFRWFNELSRRYLTSSSIEKIAKDDRLILHFAYACWNGPGWFQKYGIALKEATGTRNEIFNKAIQARTQAVSKNKLGILVANQTIRNQGDKMVKLIAARGMTAVA